MLLGDPPPTPYDLNFSLFGIPVRIHPFFWAIAILLGIRSSGAAELLVWVVALFVAILFHEFGHALAMRAYGFRPWITLYGFGGLASRDASQFGHSRGNAPLGQIIISFAGPGAGFLLAALVCGVVVLCGHEIGVLVGPPYGIAVFPIGIIGSLQLTLFIYHLLFVSVAWGLVNLLPIYPLDGGQIAREIFLLANPRDGIRQSLILSMFTAVVMAVVGLALWGSIWVGFLFGYFAYTSYKTLQAYTNQRPW